MNKKVIIIFITVITIIGIAGGIALKSLTKTETPVEVPTPTIALPTVSENIKVGLTDRNDNKVIDLKISGIPSDVETIEYELTYITGAGLPRGVLGKITTEGKSTIVRDNIDLGTCSRGKCVYDVGVKEVNLSLKFNSASGQSSVFQKIYPL